MKRIRQEIKPPLSAYEVPWGDDAPSRHPPTWAETQAYQVGPFSVQLAKRKPGGVEAAPADDDGSGSGAGDVIGLDVWPASLLLAEYLAAHKDEVLEAGRGGVVELGAGTALPSLVAAKAGCRRVVITDYDPHVRALQEASIQASKVAGVCSVRCLDWAAPAHDEVPVRSFSLALGSECLYVGWMAGGLLRAMHHVLEPEEGVMLLMHTERRALMMVDGEPGREEEDSVLAAFRAGCEGAGLHVRELGSVRHIIGGEEECALLLGVGASQDRLAALPPL
mmetsp:Transcript_48292/g.154647  ORF Transcript_48292/g.154647 Transcript_48292/m.154647 type:complete len:279 (+) Transcript_48292:195-1031(+)|eukprot:CAMPEP_0182900206 /NCGR_PEP_ID=MMETSP0034_2-20130328/28664_1 /TAXON_ID=156128 /ORGANISM="Nephroselmis pyriformis, Strain CCMP717" /LENGTH=278 /DNA_ID=CAMNT_0025034379 /DNA_START=195 /DNA_END=1031 /DNA_ORIENTATION=-